MAKLRKWAAYRKVERPYTRWSKVRAKAFVKSRPGKKVIKFDMGDIVSGPKQFPIVLRLISKDLAQIRTNAIEAARTASLKRLEKKFGRLGFYYKIKIHPHQVIRENPLAAGAGADRLSTGMKHSFGKIIGTAAKVEIGQSMIELFVPEGNENFGRQVLDLAAKKLPVRSTVTAEYKKVEELTEAELQRLKNLENKTKARNKKEAAAAAEGAKEASGEGTPSGEEKKEE